jgi:hypothetical protein
MRRLRLNDEPFVEQATAVGEQPLPAPPDVVIDTAMLLDE